MTTQQLIAQALAWFDSGHFKTTLASRVAIPSESQRTDRDDQLLRYYHETFIPAFREMGFQTKSWPTRLTPPALLLACYEEDPALPTVMCYGHGDVVFGDDARAGRKGYHRGRWWSATVTGTGAALPITKASIRSTSRHWRRCTTLAGGRLGFNCVWLCEMGEEMSSPGLAEVCQQLKTRLKADLFIASDGPRLSADRPTLFLGSRGCANFRLTINARAKDYHSGNWGGLLSNPGTQLANAIASPRWMAKAKCVSRP